MPSSTSRPGRRPNPATRQRWQQRLERFRRRGLTVPAVCKREGVSTASFYAWRRRLRHHPTPPPSDTPRLVPVRLAAPPAGAPVELVLPSGMVLRMSAEVDLGWLRQLLGLLGLAPCGRCRRPSRSGVRRRRHSIAVRRHSSLVPPLVLWEYKDGARA